MRDVSQVERQLFILSLLSESKKGCTIEDIIRQLSIIGIAVSRRTIERDIDFISTGNFFVTEERRGREIYYKANKFAIKNVAFTPSELISLYFIKELLISYSALDIGITSSNLINRIMLNLPKPDKAYIEAISELLKVHQSYTGLEKDLSMEIINTIRRSIEKNEKLFIIYHSFHKDEITERIFDPYLIEICEGCYHLIGYCHYRNGIRDLRISRIKKAKPLDEKFKRPENFYENYKKDRFGKLAGEEEIELILKFNGEAARYIKEYEAAKADVLVEEGDGSLLFRKNTTLTPDIIQWILGFGEGVKVLKPVRVKDMVVEQIKGMVERYGI